MSEVEIECDLRDLFGPARDQGARPTCMAFAASDTHAAVRPDWTPLSCEFVFFHAVARDGGHPNDGCTVEAMLDAIRNDGQPPETEWGYLPDTPSDLAGWKPPPNIEPLFKRKSKFRPTNLETIVSELDSGHPVILAMSLSGAFFRPDGTGLIDCNEPPEPAIRHAVIAAGHGKKDGKRMILIRNSWGVTWGLDGYAWMSEKYLDQKIGLLARLSKDLTNVSANSDTADMCSSVA